MNQIDTPAGHKRKKGQTNQHELRNKQQTISSRKSLLVYGHQKLCVWPRSLPPVVKGAVDQVVPWLDSWKNLMGLPDMWNEITRFLTDVDLNNLVMADVNSKVGLFNLIDNSVLWDETDCDVN